MTARKRTPRVYAWPNSPDVAMIDLSPDIVSMTVQKTIAAPTGKFHLTLQVGTVQTPRGMGSAQRMAWLYGALQPNSVVSIGVDFDGGIMLGLVDSVRRTVNRVGQEVVSMLEISGSDFGKALLDNIVYAHPTVKGEVEYRAGIESALGQGHPLTKVITALAAPKNHDGTPTFDKQPLDVVIDWVLENAGSMSIPLLRSATMGSGRLSDYIDTRYSVTTWPGAQLNSDAPSTYEGTVWGFLQSLLDMDFYEVRVDTLPSNGALPNVVLIVRPKPFDDPVLDFLPTTTKPGIDWPRLQTLIDGTPHHELTQADLLVEQIGYSDSNSFAFYQVTAEHDLIGNAQSAQEGLFYPAVDTYIARRLGIKSYRANVSLTNSDVFEQSRGTQALVSDAIEQRNRLVNWHRIAHRMEAGTATTHGRDKYRPGDKVRVKDRPGVDGRSRGVDFYCTGVDWTWSVGKHYQCKLELHRGYNADVVGEFKDHVLIDFNAANPSHLAVTGG